MAFLITLLLTFAVVAVAMWVFVKVGTPVYRLDSDNVIALLELVLSGKATENDWQVFVGIPLRHNSELSDLQKRCEALTETEYTGLKNNKLFTAKGLAELELMLLELKPQADRTQSGDKQVDPENDLDPEPRVQPKERS